MIKRRHAIVGTVALMAAPLVALGKTRKSGLRISTNPDDPGYETWLKYRNDYDVTVYVDGKQIRSPSTSDEYEGYVISATFDKDGDIIFDEENDRFVETTHRGKVTNVFRPRGINWTYEQGTPLPAFKFVEIP